LGGSRTTARGINPQKGHTMSKNTMNTNTTATAKTIIEDNGTIGNITRNAIKKKSTVELIAETNAQGVTMEYLAIDGQKIGTMGYTSQKDRQAALDFVQRIVDNSDKTGMALYMEIMETAMTGAAMTETGIAAKESEEVEIDGVPLIINYTEKKSYIGINAELKDIANLDDLTCELPEEAIKALLVERSKTWIAENMNSSDEDDMDW